MKARCDQGHTVPERQPIRLVVGESVEAGDRATNWPEFVFVTTKDGSGWVPARHLSGNRGRVLVDVEYDTTELAVTPGQEVTVLTKDNLSGWWWCRSDDGTEGWVPVAAFDR